MKLRKGLYPRYLPTLLLLPQNVLPGPWLRDGFDDVLHMPLQKDVLSVRIEAFLRLRQNLETAIQESHERFRTTFDLAPVGIAHHSVDGTITMANRRFCELLGYSEDELLATSVTALTHPDDRSRSLDLMNTMIEQQEPASRSIEKRYLHREGGTIWANLARTLVVATADKPAYFIVTIEDITQRKRSHEELQKSQAALKMASRMSRLGAWQVKLPEFEVMWSEETCAIHEVSTIYSPSVEKGIEFYAPEYRAEIQRLFANCVSDGTAFDVELQIITAKGRRVWVRSMGEAQRDALGKITRVQGAVQDISATKESEVRERALAERLASTLEKITDGFCTLDPQWRFTYISGRAAKVMRRDAHELLYQSIWDEFPQAVGSIFQQQYQRAVETNKPVHFEEFYPALGVWLAISAYPSADGLGIYFRDVTEKRDAEKQLRLLETAVAHLNDIVLITEAYPIDPPGPRIVLVNDAFFKLTGYSREETIGQSPRMLQGPQTSRPELDRIRAALGDGQPIHSELINYGKDGTQYWLAIDIVPIRDSKGVVTHFAAIERDITAQKNAEAQIAAANRALLMLSLCNEALFRSDAEPDLLDRVCKIAVHHGGYRMAFVAYALQDEAKSIVPQAHAGLEEGYLNGISLTWSADDPTGLGPAGATIRNGEAVAIADLTSFEGFSPWLEAAEERGYAGVVALPLRDAERTFGVLCLFTSEVREVAADEMQRMTELADDLAFGIISLRTRDEHRKAQVEVQKLNAELEQRVSDRTTELVEANRELESFSYSVSHDLRAPLRVVEGFSGAALTDYGSLLPADGRRLLERIRAGAQRMGVLIDDLLAFSQVGRQQLRSLPVQTTALVGEVLASLTNIYPGRESGVCIGNLPDCYGDRSLLRQVWTNLLSNALKYSSKASVPRIEIICVETDLEQVFSVQDNGAGFNMTYADKLFGVFQRLHNEREFEGTGVGLAIVKQIIERHAGRVWAEGVENQGATFYFTLRKHDT